MAVAIPGTIARLVDGSQTGLQRAQTFSRVKLDGAQELVLALIRLSTKFGEDATIPLTAAAKKAARPIMDLYIENISDVTGNLRRSVEIRDPVKKYPATGIAVAGPAHVKSDKEWDVLKKKAGNHAWLVEFGTGRRKPGSLKRRTFVNVHQRINGRMRRIGNNGRRWFNNEEFENLGRGYYFLMGSINEEHPERREGSGAFVLTKYDKRKQKRDKLTRPYLLRPGETYGAMPPSNAMEQAINRGKTQAFGVLQKELRKLINERRL